jgi:hypothetical protein
MPQKEVIIVHNCNYDKVALLHELKSIYWRLDQYSKDADEQNHPLCRKVYEDLKKDLDKHIKKLQAAVVGLAKEGKFDFCDKC